MSPRSPKAEARRVWTQHRLIALAMLCVAALPSRAQTVNVVFDDARGTNWWETVWNCAQGGAPTYDLTQSGTVASGTRAIEVDHACSGGWGAFGFDHRKQNWTKIYYITPKSGDALTFRFNPGASVADDAALGITLNIGSNGVEKKVAAYLPADVQPDTWYTVTIPLLDLMKKPVKFYRIYFWNMSSTTHAHYFLDDVAVVLGGTAPAPTPPVFTGVAVSDVGPDSARVSWTTDKQSRFTFRYNRDGQPVAETFASYATSGSITMRGLSPLTTYAFEVEALAFGADPSQPGATAVHRGSLTTIDYDRTPPVLSDVQVEPHATFANLTWRTDEPADARVEYGAAGYTEAAEDAALVTEHALSLADLQPGTTYRFRLSGRDARGNEGRYESAEAVFTTPEAPSEARRTVIYDEARRENWWETRWDCGPGQPAYDFDQTAVVASGQKAIEVRHDCPGGWGAFGLDHRKADWSEVYYFYPGPGDAVTFRFNAGADVADDAGLHVTLDLHELNANRKITDYLPSPVRPNTWYTVTIPLLDLMATPTRFFRVYFFNMASTQPHYYLDDLALAWSTAETPPAFTSVDVTDVGPDSARVSWSTDRQSRFTFRYVKDGVTVEEAFADYAATGTLVVRGLAPGTDYPFEIEALAFGADPSAPGAVGRYEGVFTTADADRTPPVFSGVAVEVFATRAVVTWTTDEPSDGRVAYGTAGYTDEVAAGVRATSHRAVLTGLAPATTYVYRLHGTDVYGNEGVHESFPPFTFTTIDPPGAVLTVDASQFVRPFNDGIRGQAFGNWAFYYNRPYANDSPKLLELTRLIRPGFLRYAGGLVSNNMMWSRENVQGYPSGMMDTNGDGTPDKWGMRSYLDPLVDGANTCGPAPVGKPGAYKYMYQAEEMDRLAAFARYVDADVMIEVDVTTCDPAMWADMVRYVNVEKGYGFRYWELGNELDLDYVNGITDIPVGADYVRVFKTYHDALKAVDPAIRISGPTTASHALDDNYFMPYERYIDPLTADAEVRDREMLGAFTFHYYPLWKSWSSRPTYHDMMNFTHQIPRRGRDYVPTMLGGMRRVLDERGFREVPIAITEFNAIAADVYTPLTYNHANALFMADMLGRLAYHGADEIAHWLLFDKASETSYGITDHNESAIMRDYDGNVTLDDRYAPMPVYYAFLMYGQLFGDRLVKTTSTMEDKLSIWASTDTEEPGALKLIVTNLSDEAVSATIDLAGTSVQTARAFEMANARWTAATDKESVNDGTTINGLSIDATSAQAILSSARAIMASGRPVAATETTLSYTFQPYTAVAILVNARDVALADIPALEPPVLLPPVPGATPALQWQGAPRAHTYHVQVAPDPSFAAPILDRRNVTEAGVRVKGLSEGATYYARVRSAVLAEESPWSPVQAFTTAGEVPAPAVFTASAAAETASPVEGEAEVSPAYPNPFNPMTSFQVRLAKAQRLRVEVFNAIGQRVAILHDGHVEATAPATFTFDAGRLASGVYLYRVQGETFVQTGRMLLLK